ncbi:MAG: helix-turn-helix transcriptional regulator, partial [Lentisphaeria bacterium]|nr:helix-turn-helix transcriptional regulator [Lentisphaeria bacterium]
PPSLSEAAKMCALSPSRFSELFRRTMGVSYGKFAIRVRMSNAAKDLLSGRFSLEEISQKWGFFDSAHFCHSFKKFYRISPSQFVSRKTGSA